MLVCICCCGDLYLKENFQQSPFSGFRFLRQIHVCNLNVTCHQALQQLSVPAVLMLPLFRTASRDM